MSRISLLLMLALATPLAAAPALALEGLAPAGPCAEEEAPPAGPVAKLFSPLNVASSGPALAVNVALSQGFPGPGPCDTAVGCGGLNDLPGGRIDPPINPPGEGEPPEFDPELHFDPTLRRDSGAEIGAFPGSNSPAPPLRLPGLEASAMAADPGIEVFHQARE